MAHSNELVLDRFAYTPQGTFGTIQLPNRLIYTVERMWADNLRRVSCIPEGDYTCKPRKYNRGGYPAIHITNVPDRSYILFHKGNIQTHVEGCIAPGMYLGALENQWAVLRSREAFDFLMDWANEQFEKDGSFNLTIRSNYGHN